MHKQTRKNTLDRKKEKKEGYILLLSVLIISIFLALSFGIYSLSIREIINASFLRDSAKAFSAADRAGECALYWDREYAANSMPFTIFATSSSYITTSADIGFNPINAICDGKQLIDAGVTGWTVYDVDSTSAKTDFHLDFDNDGSCADVTVSKTDLGTNIFISGYNDCRPSAARQVQRAIEIKSSL